MYPGTFARIDPRRAAVIMGTTGTVVTYAELNARSNQLAWFFREVGLRRGDHIAILMENHPAYLEIVWAGLRAGLYVTPVNSRLTASEAAFIVDDCDASLLCTSAHMSAVAGPLACHAPKLERLLMVDGVVDGYEPYEATIAAFPTEEVPDETYGALMFYTSGTTGRPKGVQRPLSNAPASDGHPYAEALCARYGLRESCVYLSSAPLYHGAPLHFSLASQSVGATVVVAERFDARQALELIERYRVTHSQWVPTMFVRMLKLSEAERTRYDLSTLENAIHAAAPCPVWVKEQMIAWWGPILLEYYGSTEDIGGTFITSADWLAHKGSVGKPQDSVIHICTDDGTELPIGDIGLVYFETPTSRSTYYKDAAKTSSTQHPDHPRWRTVGDIGYLDGEGFLYLTDRRAFTIVSGGVNIYPQEVEDVLLAHPSVADVAVFGVPDDDMGEAVKAVVQPTEPVPDAPGLTEVLMRFCRAQLAAYKCPQTIDFDQQLPRLDNGKIYKRALRARYWPA
jgi:acyl-CoA synthetase (AMP-forming)/AMP-acid ligase II